MTPLDTLEYLKNRITTLSLNHKIGNRDIAKREVSDIVKGIEIHVIPTLEKALTPPTADEVCNELDKWYFEATGYLLFANINDFTYEKKEKRFY